MPNTLRRTSGVLCIANLLLLPAVQAADELPRYRLKPGQELIYRQSSEFRYGTLQKPGIHGNDDEWHVWVVRQNGDGSWRLLLRQSQTPWTGTSWIFPQKHKRPASHLWGYCDLFPDGRFGPDASLGFRLDPSALFPRLPATAATKEWESWFERDAVHTRFVFDPKASEPDKSWVFTGVRETPLDKIYLSTSQATYTFNPARGLIEKTAGTYSQGYGFIGKGTGSIDLVSVKEPSGDVVRLLSTDAEAYFKVRKEYDELCKQAEMQANAKDTLAKSEELLKNLRAKLTQPLLQETVDAELTQHRGLAKYYAEAGAERAALLGKPAADWSTKDLDGKPVALKDFQGKVVVLDFWYRGCGWCMRAMPQVIQLSDDFRGKPVAVLGMCTDKKEEDGKFVIEKMGLHYPVLHAEGLPLKYHVNGFPTLIIIDTKGVVRDIHIGYSPTLHDDVSRTIEKLLAETKGAVN